MSSAASAAELLARNDERFATSARELDEHEWASPSLCAEWTNHEVLAHLVVGYSAPVHAVAGQMIRHRGNFDAANTRMARDLAAHRAPPQLLDDFDRLRAHPRGIGALLPKRLLLGDHVMHELDIVFALGREPSIPGDILAAVLQTEVSILNPFVPARRRAQGLTLHATDTAWTHRNEPGHDRIVYGAAADLASVLAGRPHALPRLTGAGVDRLHATLGRVTS